jgi:EAL domain-containing protein (putative c-di-GMP-specific phosphodiesterase class I)
MYAVKRQGRKGFQYFAASMQEAAVSRMRVVAELRTALERKEFFVVYQPIWDMRSGVIAKAEALIRWQNPHLGLVSPADFIPLAEEEGLIADIGDWVFDQAARQAKLWRTHQRPEFQVSVNVSPAQFRGKGFVNRGWFEHLQAMELSGSALAVEITEGLLLKTDSDVTGHLLALRDAGIQVALDDFGTGYSSLSYLKRLDIDYIKIDRSFVMALQPDSDDLALCSAIIEMAHRLGLKVVAEGVETQQQCDLLMALGCDFGQGYLVSRPVLPEAFEMLLQ